MYRNNPNPGPTLEKAMNVKKLPNPKVSNRFIVSVRINTQYKNKSQNHHDMQPISKISNWKTFLVVDITLPTAAVAEESAIHTMVRNVLCKVLTTGGPSKQT